MRILVGVFLFLLAVTTAAAVALFSGAISIAQQQAPVPTPNPASPVAAPAASAQAAPGDPSAGAAQPPQVKVVKSQTYGDWIYTCLENQSTKATRCSIAQELSESTSKRMIFLWRISQDGKGGLVSLWQTPEGTMLRAGITIDVGTPKPISIPYETCMGDRCQAVANLAADFQGSLSKAAKATATIVLRNGKSVPLPISVKGLADGLAALGQ